MKASDWLRAVNAACETHFPDKPRRQEVLRETRVKVRVEIGPTVFADLFYREETGRTDYALIVSGQRLYGLVTLAGGTSIRSVPQTLTSPLIRPRRRRRCVCFRQQRAK